MESCVFNMATLRCFEIYPVGRNMVKYIRNADLKYWPARKSEKDTWRGHELFPSSVAWELFRGLSNLLYMCAGCSLLGDYDIGA
jgi:hypothetical protein